MELNVISRATAALEFVNGVYEASILQMKALPYKLYLKTEHWQHFRIEALKFYQHKCQLCNEKEKQLDVHHRDYKNLGCETFNDVIVLCDPCHKTFHDSLSGCCMSDAEIHGLIDGM